MTGRPAWTPAGKVQPASPRPPLRCRPGLRGARAACAAARAQATACAAARGQATACVAARAQATACAAACLQAMVLRRTSWTAGSYQGAATSSRRRTCAVFGLCLRTQVTCGRLAPRGRQHNWPAPEAPTSHWLAPCAPPDIAVVTPVLGASGFCCAGPASDTLAHGRPAASRAQERQDRLRARGRTPTYNSNRLRDAARCSSRPTIPMQLDCRSSSMFSQNATRGGSLKNAHSHLSSADSRRRTSTRPG